MAEEPATPDLAELARSVNAAWNRRDADAVLSFFSSDVVYRPIPTFTDSLERRGRDAFRSFMQEFQAAWADDFLQTPETIRVYGDVLIALSRFTGHARASGIEVSGAVFQVFRFRGGQITRLEEFTDRAEALQAAGVES
jgi:uncharacterized protein (TIGR02246 family)